MKNALLALIVLSFSLQLSAQKYFTREGKVAFLSETPMENIEAHNTKATVVLDSESGKMEFAVLIQAFQFEKALMQEHFNENYMESDKFPKAIFKGQITNLETVNFGQDGSYPVNVTGELTIHGVTKTVSTTGIITRKGDQLSAASTFMVTVADYDIDVPGVVRDNIAKEVEVTVNAELAPLNRS